MHAKETVQCTSAASFLACLLALPWQAPHLRTSHPAAQPALLQGPPTHPCPTLLRSPMLEMAKGMQKGFIFL